MKTYRLDQLAELTDGSMTGLFDYFPEGLLRHAKLNVYAKKEYIVRFDKRD